MWTAALAALGPVWTVIKPFWKYIVGAAALIGLCWYTHNWYEGKLDAAFNRGVAVTKAKDAAALEARDRQNAGIVSELKISAAKKQAELEGKLRETTLIANNFRTQLRAHRVCSDERSGRSVPGSAPSTPDVNGAASNDGPVEPAHENPDPTVGDDVILIGEACQVNTDKLITLQGYVKDVLSKIPKRR
jgi:hypothetical protein